jgi:hypothetical protein
MFDAIRTDALARLFDVEVFANTVCTDDGLIDALSKGLVFVQLYAVHEFTVRSAVRAGINCLNAMAKPPRQIKVPLLSIAVDDKLKSVSDCHETINHWPSRMKLFERLAGDDPVQANDSLMPGAGHHYKCNHLEEVWAVFGIGDPIVPEPRFRGLVDELANHRNAITHGRMTAHEVGRNYSSSDIARKISDTKAMCLHVLQVFESYCSNEANLRC